MRKLEEYKALTTVIEEDMSKGVLDELGGLYSGDGKRFLKWKGDHYIEKYAIKEGVEIICDEAMGILCSLGCCPTPGLYRLKEIQIPSSVKHIGNKAFWGLGCIRHIDLPDGLVSIGDYAFEKSGLESLNIPESVQYLGRFILKDCYSLDKYIEANQDGLSRFLIAQARDYDKALEEVQAGKKISHWIWYIFPQMNGLGSSEKSKYYGIKGRYEAERYINHPVLRYRLVEITQAVLDNNNSVYDIFGADTIKVRSCMKLFSTVSDIPVFKKMLQKYNWN